MPVTAIDGVVRTIDGAARSYPCPECCGEPDPGVYYRRARLCPGQPCAPNTGFVPEIYVAESTLCPATGGGYFPMGVGQVFKAFGLCWKLENQALDPRFKACPPVEPGVTCLPVPVVIAQQQHIEECFNNCEACPLTQIYFHAEPCACVGSGTTPCVVVPCKALLEAMEQNGPCVVFARGGKCYKVSLYSAWSLGPGTCDIEPSPGPQYIVGKCCKCCASLSTCCYVEDNVTIPPDLGQSVAYACCFDANGPVHRQVRFHQIIDFRPAGLVGPQAYQVIDGEGTLTATGQTIKYVERRGPDPDNLTFFDEYERTNPGPCFTPFRLRTSNNLTPIDVLFLTAGGGQTLVRTGSAGANCGRWWAILTQYLVASNGAQSTPTITYDVEITQVTTKGQCPANCAGAGGLAPIGPINPFPPGGGEGVSGILAALAGLGVRP